MTPLVSVIMPTYNHEKYISQAIESLLSQNTKYSYELIINDDYSNDKTAIIAKDYAEKYPDKIFFLSPGNTNQGLLKSYKKLINNARGKYIAILESDDLWGNELKLEKQVSFLEENNEYGLCASDFIRIDEHSCIIDSVSHDFYKELDGNWFHQEICQNMICAATAIFRKDIFFKFCNIDEYIENKFKTFDYPTWLLISANSKCKYIPEKLASYRIIKSSISNSGNFRKRISFENGVTDIQNYIIRKYPEKNINLYKVEEQRILRYLNICLKFSKLFHFIFYAKRLHSDIFKFKMLHFFPILWYFQHKLRIK